MQAGQSSTYLPPPGHTVGWIAVHRGRVATTEPIESGEAAVFEVSNSPLHFIALEDVDFILGSAVKHDSELVLGYYSVHTTRDALARGEAGIARLANDPRAKGKIA